MRKPTRDTREWNRIHSKKLFERGLLSRRRAKSLRRRLSPNPRLTQQEILAKVQHREFEVAPENLAFFADTAQATIEFIQSIHRIVEEGNKVLIDFSGTTGFTAAGAVYLYSEIERLKALHGATVIRFALKSVGNPIKYLLRESGLLQLAHGDPDPTGAILPIIGGQDDDRIQEIVNYLIYKAIQRQELKTKGPIYLARY